MRFFLKCTLYITVLIFTIVLLPREYVNSLTTNPVMEKISIQEDSTRAMMKPPM